VKFSYSVQLLNSDYVFSVNKCYSKVTYTYMYDTIFAGMMCNLYRFSSNNNYVVFMSFKIRLACAGDYAAEHIFISAEISLFCYRLQSLCDTGVKSFLHQFHRLREHFLNATDTLNPCVELKEVREFLSVLDDCCVDWKSVIAGYLLFTKDRYGCECTEFYNNIHIPVPFRFVQWLVSQRRVMLIKGMALVEPSQLPHVLAAVFRKWLKYGMLLARMWQPYVTCGDDRFTVLFRECRVSTLLWYFYVFSFAFSKIISIC